MQSAADHGKVRRAEGKATRAALVVSAVVLGSRRGTRWWSLEVSRWRGLKGGWLRRAFLLPTAMASLGSVASHKYAFGETWEIQQVPPLSRPRARYAQSRVRRWGPVSLSGTHLMTR